MCLITTVVEEALQHDRTLLATEEEDEVPIEEAPRAETSVQSAKRVSAASSLAHGLGSLVLTLTVWVAKCQIPFLAEILEKGYQPILGHHM